AKNPSWNDFAKQTQFAPGRRKQRQYPTPFAIPNEPTATWTGRATATRKNEPTAAPSPDRCHPSAPTPERGCIEFIPKPRRVPQLNPPGPRPRIIRQHPRSRTALIYVHVLGERRHLRPVGAQEM